MLITISGRCQLSVVADGGLFVGAPLRRRRVAACRVQRLRGALRRQRGRRPVQYQRPRRAPARRPGRGPVRPARTGRLSVVPRGPLLSLPEKDMDVGLRTPLLDFFRRGEVARDIRLLAAEGTVAPRPVEQLGLLALLTDDADPEVRATAERTLCEASIRRRSGGPRPSRRPDRAARFLPGAWPVSVERPRASRRRRSAARRHRPDRLRSGGAVGQNRRRRPSSGSPT